VIPREPFEVSDVIASFMLARSPAPTVLGAMTRTATSRPPLARTPGRRCWAVGAATSTTLGPTERAAESLRLRL
jgi:hypothetical protein